MERLADGCGDSLEASVAGGVRRVVLPCGSPPRGESQGVLDLLDVTLASPQLAIVCAALVPMAVVGVRAMVRSAVAIGPASLGFARHSPTLSRHTLLDVGA